jgi:hypothetical protein
MEVTKEKEAGKADLWKVEGWWNAERSLTKEAKVAISCLPFCFCLICGKLREGLHAKSKNAKALFLIFTALLLLCLA